VIHEAAYRALGLDASFRVFDVTAERLAETVRELRESGLTQLCVSLPHKQAVLGLADRVSEEARAIGAANTLTLRGGALEADNTDWIGVTRTLEPSVPGAASARPCSARERRARGRLRAAQGSGSTSPS
jgi:shikimate dehydrogenase